MSRYCEHEVHPVLLDILRDGLQRYHLHLDPLVPQQYPTQCSNLICHQNQTGWAQLYRGRWSSDWSKLQDQYVLQNPTRQYISGQSWIQGLGRLIMDQWFQLWKLRNTDRHKRDNDIHQTSREHLIYSDIRKLYKFRLKVCPEDRRLFRESAEAHLQHQQSLDQLEEWIHMYRPAIMASVEHAASLGITQNRTLEDYPAFNPSRPVKQACLTAGLLDG